jgi:hypothetical protein
MAEEQKDAPNIDSEIEVLEQLADGSAKRHSLEPEASDFTGDSKGTYAALKKWHAQGLVESTVANPDFAEDGVQHRWQINHLGLEYLRLRGQEEKTPEEIHAEKVAEGQQQKPAPQQEQFQDQQPEQQEPPPQ